jgi:holo-[acyl-carrier protein] synthase
VIVGVGLDLIERDSVALTVARHGDRLTRWVFTETEWQRGLASKDPVQTLAECFAAKEACLKALGTGWGEGVSLRDVELIVAENGGPAILLSGGAAEHAAQAHVERVYVTIGKTARAAGAFVVLEGG